MSERVDEHDLKLCLASLDGVKRKLASEVVELRAENARLKHNLEAVRRVLEDAVCTVDPDKGIILLSDDGPTHPEIIDGREVQVYEHDYFSPLGDKLIEAWELTEPNAFEEREKLRAEWLEIVRQALGLKDGEGVVDAIERLKAREPYVQHLVECYGRYGGFNPCTCGLDKLKGAAPNDEPRPPSRRKGEHEMSEQPNWLIYYCCAANEAKAREIGQRIKGLDVLPDDVKAELRMLQNADPRWRIDRIGAAFSGSPDMMAGTLGA